MADELTILLTAASSAFMGKFVGPAAEQLGKIAWERIQQLSQRATTYLTAVGRKPQPVEPKILVPLVQAASFEADETLSEKWAALLANAADEAATVKVKPVFVDILRQMVSDEARLLDYLFQQVGADNEQALNHMINAEEIKPANVPSESDFYFFMDSLTRNRLLINAEGGMSYGPHRPSKMYYFTSLGLEFMQACSAPESL